jgi:hypothetical protein
MPIPRELAAIAHVHLHISRAGHSRVCDVEVTPVNATSSIPFGSTQPALCTADHRPGPLQTLPWGTGRNHGASL